MREKTGYLLQQELAAEVLSFSPKIQLKTLIKSDICFCLLAVLSD